MIKRLISATIIKNSGFFENLALREYAMLSLLLTYVADRNDEEDFACLYEKYKNYIYKLCFDLVHDHYLAEDCVQETFTVAAKNFDKIREIDSKRTKNFLITVAKCVSMKVYNKNVANGEVFIEDNEAVIPMKQSAEDAFFSRFSTQEIYDAIENLDEGLKLPLLLKDLYRVKHKDIAAMLGVSPEAARKRLARAKDEIRRKIE